MTEKDYVARRMGAALDKACDIAEDKERERGLILPPEIIGQMALQMFQARVTLAMRDSSGDTLPDYDERMVQ